MYTHSSPSLLFPPSTHTGVLGAVGNLSVMYEYSVFVITWTAPFSLKVPQNSSLITYCVTITEGSSKVLLSRCRNSATKYLFQFNYNPCLNYTISVIPVNPAGNGTSTQTLLLFNGIIV